MRGGKRSGAGRPAGSGKFKERTFPVRIPESLLPDVMDLIGSLASEHDVSSDLPIQKLNAASLNAAVEINGHDVALLPPMEAIDVFSLLRANGIRATTTILDPWYSRSPGKVPAKARKEIVRLISLASQVSDHVFIWGWPHEIALLVERIPPPLKYAAWLTWNAKNVPSRAHGWRHTQQSCLHVSCPSAKLFPENFSPPNSQGLFKYSCDTVIDAGALVGFAGRSQSVGHPAQKPLAAFEPLIKMTTQRGDLVLDVTAGSGTTGALCQTLNRRAILSDRSERYVRMIEKRLEIRRISSP